MKVLHKAVAVIRSIPADTTGNGRCGRSPAGAGAAISQNTCLYPCRIRRRVSFCGHRNGHQRISVSVLPSSAEFCRRFFVSGVDGRITAEFWTHSADFLRYGAGQPDTVPPQVLFGKEAKAQLRNYPVQGHIPGIGGESFHLLAGIGSQHSLRPGASG